MDWEGLDLDDMDWEGFEKEFDGEKPAPKGEEAE